MPTTDIQTHFANLLERFDRTVLLLVERPAEGDVPGDYWALLAEATPRQKAILFLLEEERKVLKDGAAFADRGG